MRPRPLLHRGSSFGVGCPLDFTLLAAMLPEAVRPGVHEAQSVVAAHGHDLFNPIPKGRLLPRDNTDLAHGVGLNSIPFNES